MTTKTMATMATESVNTQHADLDQYDSLRLVQAFADDQQLAVRAVQAAAPSLAAVVDAAVPRLRAGGRLLYVGAGTSGRLGLLDSVELLPTFSWPSERAVACLAGGDGAVRLAVEGAEDDVETGGRDLQALRVGADDVVLGIAASGRTPYVIGALKAARAAGAMTVGIVNNPGAAVAAAAEFAVVLDTGPEVISGSTRLKAGTAQKIALNTLSSAMMVRLHKVYGNLMVDLRATNAKLVQRAVALTVRAAGVTEDVARSELEHCAFHVKTAIVALRCGITVGEAQARLDACEGSVRASIASAAS